MSRVLLAAAVLGCLLHVGEVRVRGQDVPFPGAGGSGAISASGSAEIKRPAARMRLIIDLISRESDAKKAGKALNERIDNVKSELKALGAIADTIEISAPKIEAAQTDSHRQLRNMMLQRMGRGRKNAQPPESEPLITVTARLEAEWTLDAGDPFETLAKVLELQQAIREAKLSGAEAAPEMSAENEEVFEEAQMFSDMSSGQAAPGEPVFLFLTEISQADRETALKEAFSNAANNARQLARAAGAHLGGLQSLQESSTEFGSDLGSDYGYNYNSPQFQALQLARRVLSGREAEQHFAYGADPGELIYRVQVTASFSLAR